MKPFANSIAIATCALGAWVSALAMDVTALGWLCWVAVVPLLYAVRVARTRNAVAMGILFSIVHFAMVLRYFAGFGFNFYLFMVFALAAIYGAATFAICRWIAPKSPRLGVAGAWVLVEFGKSYLGLEWGSLGYTQAGNPLALQLASLIGAQGISFLVWLVNAHLAVELDSIVRSRLVQDRPAERTTNRIWRTAIAAVFLAACFHSVIVVPASTISDAAEGSDEIVGPEVAIDTVHVTVVPGHFTSEFRDQSRNLPAAKSSLIESYLNGSKPTDSPARSTVSQHPGPQLIVWPETAAGIYADRDFWMQRAFAERPLPEGTSVVLGALGYSGDVMNPLNSAYGLNNKGESVARYDKSRLVPAFEYQPFPWLWSRINPGVKFSGFTPGDGPAPLELQGLRLGVGICYEESFPDGFRRQVNAGAEMLLTLGSVAFGPAANLDSHMQVFARFRAVENRRWLVRSINAGRSEILDPYGRVVISLPEPASLLSQGSSGLASIELDVPRRTQRSLYVRWGHLLVVVTSVLATTSAISLQPSAIGYRRRVRQKGGDDRVFVRIAPER